VRVASRVGVKLPQVKPKFVSLKRGSNVAGASVSFNSVVVLESLKTGERRTAEELYDSILMPLHIAGKLNAVYARVADQAELFTALEQLAERCEQDGWFPILQVEAHGSAEGLWLSSGECVPWLDLAEPLRRINEATRLNLFLIMATCVGSNFLGAMVSISPAPVWGLIGPTKDMFPEDIIEAFQRFYTAVFEHKGGEAAIIALNEGKDPNDWDYIFMPIEWLFVAGYREYLKSGKAPALNVVSPEAAFEDVRHIVFMLEQFPENGQRFPVSWEQV
jgi:hypothetical protein